MLSFGAYSSQMVKDTTPGNRSASADQFMEESEIKIPDMSGTNTYSESVTNEENLQEATRKEFQINLQVSDEEQIWSRTTEINLFDSHYINDEENESVRSGDGRKVIAPGTQNQYLFQVTNLGTQPIRYQIWYEIEEITSGYYLPIETGMEHLNASKIRTDVAEETTDSPVKVNQKTEFLLQPETSDRYQFQWKWLYERGDDQYDTRLGDLAVGQELEYIVQIHVRAEIDSQGVSQNGSSQSEQKQSKNSQEQSGRMRAVIKTGDMAKWRYWCMVCAISLMFSILLYGGLKRIGYGTATVMSGSMEPKLKVGDLVILEPVNRKSSLKAGDIIVYRSGKKRIVHRLVSVSKNTLRVKGDANNQEDRPIQFQQVEGKVLCRIPKVGKFCSEYQKSRGASAGDKEIYGAFSNWSGGKDQASVAEFELQAEGSGDTCLVLEHQDGTDTASYSFSVTGHSQVDVKYRVFLEFEDDMELPEEVEYEITPEQGQIQAGDNTPKEHTVSFYLKQASTYGEETEQEEQNQESDLEQQEEKIIQAGDAKLAEEKQGRESQAEENDGKQSEETENEIQEIQNMVIKHIKIRIIAEQAECR